MMASATETPTMTDSTQGLIDARLDTIDRMLVGRVSRQDRLAIVREVEAQIHDLLAEQGGAEIDREAVIAVLGRLDPPEAYLPEAGEGFAPPSRGVPSRARVAARAVGEVPAEKTRIARASGILGLVAIGLLFYGATIYTAVLFSDSDGLLEIALGMILLFATGCALVAVGFAAYAKVRGAWAITGLVTGLVSGLIASLVVLAIATGNLG